MSIPVQMPAWSPVSLRGLAAGVAGLVAPASSSVGTMAARARERFGSRRVVGTDSGTSALAVAMEQARARRGVDAGPVALPAYGCYDLATAADTADLPVILYDVDPATLGPDADSLREALDAGASTVVVAHLYGVPVDMAGVAALAADAGVTIVEDAAQGFGAEHDHRPLGSIGAYGILSFGRGKGVTGGAGGALLLNDADADASFGEIAAGGGRGLGAVAAVAALWLFGRPTTYRIPAGLPFLGLGETPYHGPSPVTRIPSASARVVARIWDRALHEVEARRGRAERLRGSDELAARVRHVTAPLDSEPGWLRLPVLARDPAAAELLASERARHLGIMPGYPRPLSELPGFSGRCVGPARDLGGAGDLARTLFTLPTHSRLSPGAIEAIEELLGRG